MSTTFRRISIVLGILMLAGTIVFLYPMLSQKEAPPKKEKIETAVIREVKVMVAQNSAITSQIDVQGSLEAYNKIDIFAEVTGTLSNANRAVKAGNYFKKGTVLLDIDREEAKLNILSQKSNLLNSITTLMPDLKIDYPESFQQWKMYLDKFDVEQPIRPFPKALNEQERYFIASRNLLGSYYAIKSAENRLDKYTVYAPFSGVITQSNIHPGALVRAGQKMGELMGTGIYEMKATLGLEDLQFVKVGSKVALYSDAVAGSWTGTVRRISDQIDPNTQSVIVYIGVTGKGLKEGMYLRGNLDSKVIKNAMRIPLDLLVNQRQVYAVKEGKLTLLNVEVVQTNASHAVVQGIPDQSTLLSEKVIGAFEGLAVKPLKLLTANE
ncbi:MAG: HlyD family efflux transporter periplasmic adaptor subunit [Bacteroidota bacterium]